MGAEGNTERMETEDIDASETTTSEATEDRPEVDERHGDDPPVEDRPGAGPVSTQSIVEALLLASDSPISAQKIAGIAGDVTPSQVKACVAELNARYETTGASFRVEEIAGGFQILTLPEYNVWLRKLLKVRTESKLSQAALETLAVVAYRQPVLRAAIEEIRGVAVGEVLNRLREMNLVKIVGRAEELGRPLLYGTTKRFLEAFGLASLDQLPQVEELTPPDKQGTRRRPINATGHDDAVPPAAAEDSATTTGEAASAGEREVLAPREDAASAFARLAEATRTGPDDTAHRRTDVNDTQPE